jgi:Zn-dependent M16 (insulinase) family peptidase
MTEEAWGGLTQIQFVHGILNTPIQKISERLSQLRDAVVGRRRLVVNYTGQVAAHAFPLIQRLYGEYESPNAVTTIKIDLAPVVKRQKSAEYFVSPSLRVGFASLATKSEIQYTSTGDVAMSVLSHYLSTGALWENIRMKGGAYGANADWNPTEKIFNMTTYRDPAPEVSLAAFRKALDAERQNGQAVEGIEKAIIGAYSKIKQPLSPATKGVYDFMRFLSGITDEHRATRLEHLLALSEHDVRDAANTVYTSLEHAALGAETSVISGQKPANGNQEVIKLPI